jgi:PGF-CTERM protein
MVAALIASAFVGGIGVLATPASADQHQASVTFEGGTSGGETITVDEVVLPEGGFVTIHDSTLTDGATIASVVGTSTYLEPGTHENVTVHLDEGITDGTFHAMAHQDTDGDRAYTFVSSNAEADGPYTVDGNIVMDDAPVTVSASVSFSGQGSEGTYVIVDHVELSEGGFVTVHDSSLLDGATFESVRGTSEYLEAGTYENLRIQLDEPLQNDDTLLPMAHQDTNDNQEYDFVDTNGEADGPFVNAEGTAVLDDAQVEMSNSASVTFAPQASGGTTVVVEEVFLPDGGFVTMHDSTLNDGATFESIRGTSEYLAPGIHRNVVVTLDDPLAEDGTLIPMAHQDTNDNQAYDFATSEGDADGPYTADGDIVLASGEVTVSASVTIDRQTADGTTVVVDHVDLAEGGFVTIHDSSLAAGAVIESIRGTSQYLEAGSHENVVVELDDPLTEPNQVFAMAHQDTNDNQTYDFVTSEGGEDGPYTADGDIVMDSGTVSVTAAVFADADASSGETVVIEQATLHNGGFVTVHDSSLTDGAVIESIRGTSEYLAPGTHTNVSVTLDEPLSENDTLFAMAHLDTNGSQSYDFVTSEGAEDGPYVAASAPVMDNIDVSVSDDGMGDGDDGMDDGDDGMDDGDDSAGDDGMDDSDDSAGDDDMNDGSDGDSADDSGPGFGIAAAFVAFLAAALVAARRLA